MMPICSIRDKFASAKGPALLGLSRYDLAWPLVNSRTSLPLEAAVLLLASINQLRGPAQGVLEQPTKKPKLVHTPTTAIQQCVRCSCPYLDRG